MENKIEIETNRLIIKELSLDMIDYIQRNSLDEDNMKFVPDEVFETIDEAKEVVTFLIKQYQGKTGPFVYALITKKENKNIGYVQIIPLDDGNYEVGYHVAKDFTKQGYASEAIKSFVPIMMNNLNLKEVYGICLKENIASIKVLEKCNFTKIFEGKGLYQGAYKDIYKYILRKE